MLNRIIFAVLMAGSLCGYAQIVNPSTSGPIIGVTNGTAASSGYVGQVIQSKVPSGSAVSLSTSATVNVTSITLTPGDWDVEGSVVFKPTNITIPPGYSSRIGTTTTSASLPTDGTEVAVTPGTETVQSTLFGGTIPRQVYNVSVSTVVYLAATCDFQTGSLAVYGYLTARRVH